MTIHIQNLPHANRLLGWYGAHARVLPWRAPPKSPPSDPYHVWLSEIMLQQTTVASVIPYFKRFIERWPTVIDLANASLEDILQAWAGLGYYARARNLHACAKKIASDYRGRFPEEEAQLRTLPGIGEYTAAAIAAIAFGQRTTVVDGNVERVIARLFTVNTPLPLPAAKRELKELAEHVTPLQRAGDYAQAMMDLGATICTPRRPRCDQCPLSGGCLAFKLGNPENWPIKTPKPAKPTRQGLAFWLESGGSVWLRRRPAKGLLGGLPEFPSTSWQVDLDIKSALAAPPLEANWELKAGTVHHTFTHFHLTMSVAHARLRQPVNLVEGFWHPIESLKNIGLPTLMIKVMKLIRALPDA